MSYSVRVWAFRRILGRCSRCKRGIVRVIDDMGLSRKIELDAVPLNTYTDDEGRKWHTYDPDSIHRCRPRIDKSLPAGTH